jgi:DNA-damage-inducible protein J
MLHVRVDEATKQEATAALEAVGLSVSDAVRLFLKRVVAEKGMPFELRVPNAETLAAFEEADEIVRAARAQSLNSSDLRDDLDQVA